MFNIITWVKNKTKLNTPNTFKGIKVPASKVTDKATIKNLINSDIKIYRTVVSAP
jgi:hypothetical protein